MITNLSKKPAIFGSLAGIALLGFYFLFLSIVQTFSHAREQFSQLIKYKVEK